MEERGDPPLEPLPGPPPHVAQGWEEARAGQGPQAERVWTGLEKI